MEIGKAPVEADFSTFATWKQARNRWDAERRALRVREAKREREEAAAVQAAADLEAARQWYGSEAARLAINTCSRNWRNPIQLPDGSMVSDRVNLGEPYRPPLAPPLRSQPYKKLGRPCKRPLEAVVLGTGECSKRGWPTELRSLSCSPGGTRYPSIVFRQALPRFESEEARTLMRCLSGERRTVPQRPAR
jgi:hypothetical protein